MKRNTAILFVLSMIIPFSTRAQQAVSDSLSLSQVITKVLENYPSVKKAEIEIESANAKIGLAHSAYNPNLDLSASYSHLGPTSQITLPGYGTFDMYPANNYSTSFNLNQQLYDFGKAKKSILLEEQSKTLSELSLQQLKQRLSSSILSNYYTIVYLQEAVKVKDEELKNLNDHLQFVEKKAAAGSATQYEILTTKVRISNIENQRTDLQTNLQVQLSRLNSYLGQPNNTAVNLKRELSTLQLMEGAPSLISKAYNQREEIRMIRQQHVMSESKMAVVNAQNNARFDAFASGGFKNGYTPSLNTIKGNYVLGITFKMPILDGNRSKYNRMQVKNEMLQEDQEEEQTRRNISDEVVEYKANVDAALKKIASTELQFKQASQAYALAQTSYKAGTITNLDLLDSSTSLSESSLAVTKSRIDYTVSVYMLKLALGDRIY